ncbi:DUF4180 domain-containing protein [Pedobacter sp. LMG 31464]|uniref:DUF4180 domain-containing protein n=1 Tax=Pedobacter planticolens TaxID=2679964 RepID=A0A923E0F2_9SPHI|nr:DUF4180 domain-containing protein [Pedobacter planticolens]MBB2145970.1 DUF4180 domain-containing protein [Pedobacter planticolens]
MEIKEHLINNIKIAEVTANDIIIRNADDGLDLLGNLYYSGFDRIVIYEQNITPDFFDLKNGLAGEILQKFSNYRVKLVIVGNFTDYTTKSIKDFIRESNNGNHINFLPNTADALQKLSN